MYDHRRLFTRISRILSDDPGASLGSIARALHVHPHTAAQVVREHTGVSFSDWRRQQRLTLTLSLLRTRPDMSIKEIAAAAGFGSTSVFDRFARRTCGCSPSQFRTAPDASDRHEVTLSAERSTAPGSQVNGLARESTDSGAHAAELDATLDSSTASS